MRYLFTICEHCREVIRGKTLEGVKSKPFSIGIRGTVTVFVDESKYIHVPYIPDITKEESGKKEYEFCDSSCFGKWIKAGIKKHNEKSYE